MAEVGNCPIFVAENGNIVHISADSDIKIETKRKYPFRRVEKRKLLI